MSKADSAAIYTKCHLDYDMSIRSKPIIGGVYVDIFHSW